MENSYDEGSAVEPEIDDHALFLKHVIGDDHDLLTIDSLLKEAFAAGSDE